MKKFIIVLSTLFLYTAEFSIDFLTDKFYCDDEHVPKSKVAALRHEIEENKYEYYIKGYCKGKKYLESDNDLAACIDPDDYFNSDKLLVKKGKSCKYNEDCRYGYCIDNKCQDKCKNECKVGKGQFCDSTNDKDYKCYEFAKEGEKTTDDKPRCPPETTNDKDGKCIKYYSLPDRTEANYEYLCESNFVYDGKCRSIEKVEGKCGDATNPPMYVLDGGSDKVLVSDDDPNNIYHPYNYYDQTKCVKYTKFDKFEPPRNGARQKYFKEKVAKRFKDKVNPDKLAKKEDYEEDIKYYESKIVYDNWFKFRLNDIIDDEGEIQDGKKTCYKFMLNSLSSSNIKTSFVLALFALFL